MLMLSPLVAFAVALIFIFWLMKGGLSKLAVDEPNHRSLHTSPTPRTGGLALMTGAIVGWAVIRHPTIWLITPPVLLLMVVSFLDDVCDLTPLMRLVAHMLAAGIFVWIADIYPFGMLAVVLLLALVWMINLYNFMDGSNGLAGGMALFGFASYAIAAWQAGDAQLAAMNASVAAASLAFLLFNFHPARIFLGDAGSVPLGFVAGAMGAYGWRLGLWPIWFPLLVFSPFIVDATVTLLKRLLRGEKVWQAHCSHYYQRLVQMGWGHRKTALTFYCLMSGAGGSAILMQHASGAGAVGMLVAWMLLYSGLLGIVDRHCRIKQNASPDF